jgi:isocitrate dehydrogenase
MLYYTLEQGVHTGDFGDRSTPSANTDALPMRLLPTLASYLQKGAVVAQPDMEVKANHDHPLKK